MVNELWNKQKSSFNNFNAQLLYIHFSVPCMYVAMLYRIYDSYYQLIETCHMISLDSTSQILYSLRYVQAVHPESIFMNSFLKHNHFITGEMK